MTWHQPSISPILEGIWNNSKLMRTTPMQTYTILQVFISMLFFGIYLAALLILSLYILCCPLLCTWRFPIHPGTPQIIHLFFYVDFAFETNQLLGIPHNLGKLRLPSFMTSRCWCAGITRKRCAASPSCRTQPLLRRSQNDQNVMDAVSWKMEVASEYLLPGLFSFDIVAESLFSNANQDIVVPS